MAVYIKLINNIKIRQEHFAGLLLNRKTGTVIDLDRQAYVLVNFLQRNILSSYSEIKSFLSLNMENELDFQKVSST